jgi:hypothetical protein
VPDRDREVLRLQAVVTGSPMPGHPERVCVELFAVLGSGQRVSSRETSGGLFVTLDVLGNHAASPPATDWEHALEEHVREAISGELVPPEWRFRPIIEALASYGVEVTPAILDDVPLDIELRLA